MPKKDTINMSLVTAELEGAGDLVAAQVKAGLNRDDVVQKLFTSISSMLSKITSLTAKDKLLLTRKVCEGPWSEEQIKELADMFTDDDVQLVSKVNKNRKNQECMFFENMIDQDSWARLRHKGTGNPTR